MVSRLASIRAGSVIVAAVERHVEVAPHEDFLASPDSEAVRYRELIGIAPHHVLQALQANSHPLRAPEATKAVTSASRFE